MCRVLAYLGEPLLLEDLLYKPDVSLVSQTYQAALLHRLNLAGAGLLAWDERSEQPGLPFVHRSTQLAIFDRNPRGPPSLRRTRPACPSGCRSTPPNSRR